MKENNEKKKLVLILSCLGIILLLAGVSFSLVNFIFKGDREHVIDLNGLSFSYEEQKNGLSLTNLKPLNDTNGLASGNDYTFRVSATSKTAREVPYHIYLTVDNQNTLDSKYVRVNITNTTTNISAGPINIDKLRLKQNSNDDYYLMEDNFSFDGETPNLSNMYKLTIWVNEDYTRGDNYTVENNEQTTTYGGETFNFKISVATGKMPELDSTYANAPVLATNMIPVYYADGE